MSGLTKLSREHLALNAAFPWPTTWPANLDEAIGLLDRHTPHASIYTVNPPVHPRRLAAVERRLGRPIPPPYRTFLSRHDGLLGEWTGGHPLICPAGDLEGLVGEFEWALEEAVDSRREDGRKVEQWKPGLMGRRSDWRRFQMKKFFPFGRDDSGNSWVLYVGARAAGGEHPVFQLLHDEATLSLRFTSFANYLWYLICEGHTHPQAGDARLRPFESERSGKEEPELRFTR